MYEKGYMCINFRNSRYLMPEILGLKNIIKRLLNQDHALF